LGPDPLAVALQQHTLGPHKGYFLVCLVCPGKTHRPDGFISGSTSWSSYPRDSHRVCRGTTRKTTHCHCFRNLFTDGTLFFNQPVRYAREISFSLITVRNQATIKPIGAAGNHSQEVGNTATGTGLYSNQSTLLAYKLFAEAIAEFDNILGIACH
jgi:hypothetical protein